VRVDVKAVLVGALGSLVISVALRALVLFLHGWTYVARGTPPGDVKGLPPGPAFLPLALAFALASLVAGGFLAGGIARRGRVLHGALVGAVALAVSLLAGGGARPAWYRAAWIVAAIPAAALGALPAVRRASRPIVPRAPRAGVSDP
jgi:hypothetical protein